MVTCIILAVVYLIALPFSILVAPSIKDAMGWRGINLLGFMSIWLIMPVYLILKLTKIW